MDTVNQITLTKEECKGVHETIMQLSGHNPENVFHWDGSDSLLDPATSAFAKIYLITGNPVPEEIEEEMKKGI